MLITLKHLLSIKPNQRSDKSCCPEFLLGSHYIAKIDWLIGHRIELGLHTLSIPLGLGWYHVAQNANPIVMWLVFLAWPTSTLPLYMAHHEEQTLLSLGKFQGLETPFQEPGPVSQILYYKTCSYWGFWLGWFISRPNLNTII